MTEEPLNRADIGAGFEEVDGERVPPIPKCGIGRSIFCLADYPRVE